MDNDKETILYAFGSLLLALGAFSVTVLPLFINHSDFIFYPTVQNYKYVSCTFYVVGALLYICSLKHYKQQLMWIGLVALYYAAFHIIVQYII